MTDEATAAPKRFDTEEEARRFVAEALKGEKDASPLVRRSKPARFTDAEFEQAMAERAAVLSAQNDGQE